MGVPGSAFQEVHCFVPCPQDGGFTLVVIYMGTLGHVPAQEFLNPNVLPRQSRGLEPASHYRGKLFQLLNESRALRIEMDKPCLQIIQASGSNSLAFLDRTKITDL